MRVAGIGRNELWQTYRIASNKWSEFVEHKPFCYHGTKKHKIYSILNKGLLPSGGVYGNGAYSKISPHKTIGHYHDNDGLVCIYLPHEKNKVSLSRKRDWIIFPEGVNKNNILYAIKIEYGYKEISLEKEHNVNNIPVYVLKVFDKDHIESSHKYINALCGNLAVQEIRRRGLPYIYVSVPIVNKVGEIW